MRFPFTAPGLALLAACASAIPAPQALPDQPVKQAELVTAGNTMTGALYKEIASDEANVFFSPISLSGAFALLDPAARGATAEEFQTVFGFSDPEVSRILMQRLETNTDMAKLTIANAAWTADQFPLKADYIDTLRTTLGAKIEQLNFASNQAAARTINRWVEARTNNQIKDLISPMALNQDTSLVLTNAIWFKADWASQFLAANTVDDTFLSATGEEEPAKLMNQNESFRYQETGLYQAIDLDYRGGEYAMSIILPKERGAIDAVEAALGGDGFANAALALETAEKTYIALTLPKVTVRTNYALSKPLKALGLIRVFDPQQADLTGLSDQGDHHVSLVVQKAFLAIDEEGTEAAAATGLVVMTTSARTGPEPISFRADHPFLLTIRHRPTGAIVFAGRIGSVSD